MNNKTLTALIIPFFGSLLRIPESTRTRRLRFLNTRGRIPGNRCVSRRPVVSGSRRFSFFHPLFPGRA